MAQVLENGFVIDGKYIEVLHEINAFKVGDIVEVIDEFEEGFNGCDYGWENSWSSDMHIGVIGEITCRSEDGFKIEDDYYYPSSVLKLVAKYQIPSADDLPVEEKNKEAAGRPAAKRYRRWITLLEDVLKHGCLPKYLQHQVHAVIEQIEGSIKYGGCKCKKTSTMDKELIQSKLGFIVDNLINIQNLVEEIQEQLDKE